jgi:chloramphenicol-sensitive protein RarD
MRHVPPFEILCHRVVWSVPFTALLITLGKDWDALAKAVSNRNVLGTLFLSATLVGATWFIYIYAVITDRLLQASLGYFINPLNISLPVSNLSWRCSITANPSTVLP